MKKFLITLSVVTAMIFTGCGSSDNDVSSTVSSGGSTESTAEDVNLTVFAAASMTEALEEIAELYQELTPNVKFNFNFDSSGNLQTQIENEAEADLFISAAQKQMDEIEDEYIESSTRKDLLTNKVVLIVPQDSEIGLTSFEDCLTGKVSLIALGNSDVPVGQYSEEIFANLAGWDTIQSKASFGSSVKEVLSQVESGSVDCGVVYSTDAATSSSVEVVASAPEDSHTPVVYPAAVLKNSGYSDEAKAFLDYLSSDEAVAVFEKIGFEVVK